MSSTRDGQGSTGAAGHELSQLSMPMAFSAEVVEDLLYSFDVKEDEREFLTSLITGNRAPRDEVEKLYDLSLMRGAEDWDMLIECATSLRDRVCSHRYGSELTPYLAVVHLQQHGRWPAFEGDACVKPQPKTRNQQRRRTSITKAPIAKPDVPRSLGRQQTTSHFFNDEIVSTKPALWQQRSPRRTGTSSPQTNPVQQSQTLGKPHEVTGNKRRRANSELSATADTRRPVATRLQIEQNDTSTAGHFLPPPKSDDNTCGGAQGGVKVAANGYGLLKSSVASTEDETPRRKRTTRTDRATTSHFFATPTDPKSPTPSPSPSKRRTTRPARGILSALPIPPLSATRFGLIQEELADEPFKLLIAVTFLIRTAGRAAIPVFRELIAQYPSPESLAAADPANIIPMIHHLGLSSNRCAAIRKYARIWIERPPVRDVRYGVKNYPRQGDGKDVKSGEEFGAEDNDIPPDLEEDENLDPNPSPRTKARGFGTSWEIGHVTQGPYAIDSWRIFCRDILLGRAEDWKGKGRAPDFQPEWMRVLPQDKELRACLRWMWMREGWWWDPLTGEREVLSERMRRAVDEGRVAYNNQGELRILDE